MSTKPVITLKDAVLRDASFGFPDPLSFTLNSGEHLAVVGPNGSGKTTFIATLLGRRPLKSGSLAHNFPDGGMVSDNIGYIAFQGAYGSVSGGYYYQQRWNSTDREDIPFAGELLAGVDADAGLRGELYSLLGIEPLLGKEIITLSSGELRKFQIARTLLASPGILIIDNPYIGLDFQARGVLDRVLEQLAAHSRVQIVLVMTSREHIPSFITHLYDIGKRLPGAKIPWRHDGQKRDTGGGADVCGQPPVEEPQAFGYTNQADEIIKFRNITIRYGDKTILDNESWTVRRGERWALSGLNGSGKSTLLSLVSADNPQSYSQDISLFGRRRGTGESIWDIKRRIGFVSSEMHNSYMEDIPAVKVVASGFFDSLGLYRSPDEAQLAGAGAWMERFGTGGLGERSFLKLSSGEQRMVLLARAFVKEPELLILDEPLNGLDPANKRRVLDIIENYSSRPGKTLIVVTHYEEDLPSCVTKRHRLVAPAQR